MAFRAEMSAGSRSGEDALVATETSRRSMVSGGCEDLVGAGWDVSSSCAPSEVGLYPTAREPLSDKRQTGHVPPGSACATAATRIKAQHHLITYFNQLSIAARAGCHNPAPGVLVSDQFYLANQSARVPVPTLVATPPSPSFVVGPKDNGSDLLDATPRVSR
jgi:hypothetical protein